MWEVLNALRVFDWITPTKVIMEELTNGGGQPFIMDAAIGRDSMQQRLDRAGIRSWGYFLTEDGKHIAFAVEPGKVNTAENALGNIRCHYKSEDRGCGGTAVLMLFMCVIVMGMLLVMCR